MKHEVSLISAPKFRAHSCIHISSAPAWSKSPVSNAIVKWQSRLCRCFHHQKGANWAFQHFLIEHVHAAN
jgi:hypothetical protein